MGLNKQQQVRLKAAIVDGVESIEALCAHIGVSVEDKEVVEQYANIFGDDPAVVARHNAAQVAKARAKGRVKLLEEYDAETRKLVSEAGVIEKAEPTRQELFAEAVAKLSEDDFTADGTPSCDALEDAGFECSAQERDEFWSNHQA